MNPQEPDLQAARRAAAAVAGRLVGATDAEDVAQEVALRAVPRWKQIAPYAGPWAVRVATNLSLDLLRQRDRQSYADVPETLSQAVDSDLRVDLQEALLRLPERQRQVVALRHLSDLDEKTTAELLGIAPGSVKRHLHRAVAALRTSPHLTVSPPPPAPEEAPRMHDWTKHWTPAIEPTAGWPDRPWDHWRMESRIGHVLRLAVVDGEPVLDAEGDEVMSGPGFDHHVVKVLPAAWRDEPEPEQRLYEELPGLLGELLREALEEAHYFGHMWLGDEHLGMVLAARRTPGVPELEVLERGVAAFYEGPFAERRLELVHQRRAGQDFPRDPVPKTLTLFIEQLLEATAGTDPGITEIRDRLLDRPYSFVRHVTAG